MVFTFRHDGTGHRPAVESVRVTITAAGHTYHSGQRMSGRNWLVWHPFQADECWHADTLAEAVWQGAGFAADLMGGCVLVLVAGVPVAPEWDTVALLERSWQADPPFSDWRAVVAEVAGAVCPECRVPVDAMPGERWQLCGLCAALQPPPPHYGPPDHVPA